MSNPIDKRRQRLLPNGIPKYIRVYDNGGGFTRVCRACLNFSDAELCDVNQCGHKTLKVEEGAGSFDRYTVVFTGNYAGRGGRCHYLGMSCHPTHPQGFGQHEEHDTVIDAPCGFPPKVGDKNRLGRRITFQRLPPDCQRLVLYDYRSIWGLELAPPIRYNSHRRRMTKCHSDCDGDCTWEGCPQFLDGEPEKSGRHCPLDN